MSDEFIQLCTRILSREASPEERRRFERLIEDPERREYFDELRSRWQAFEAPPAPKFDQEGAWERLMSTVEEDRAPAAISRPRRAWIGRVSWAAAACAAFGAVWFVVSRTEQPHEVPEVRWTEWRAAMGERPTVKLADGTRVTLNGDSVLSAPVSFGGGREVRLRGEAYFEVARDARHPFIVEAGGLKTTVLGTAFNVSAYAGDAESAVALVDGSIEVQPAESSTTAAPQRLQPGQRLRFVRETGSRVVEDFDSDAVVGWLKGVLAFRDEKLPVIMRRLEQRFRVRFEAMDPALSGKALSGQFEKESLTEILEILSFAGGVRYELIRENGVIVRVRLWSADVR